ncbi:indole-3-glycerol phosphate synthase [Leuconostoc mesenteroides subsp. mesenteroides]|uniref:indole-3-glycerol phosphate synthase TrpC n=1 Tax=Leuconostoc mesenteroides TaxID=1245 RepID=UPI000A02015D|nr:indole-3-glycerol phosphate synthase TrpC [Leuconostoc mesenteroides]ARN63625.1 indole-3-glycerol phosphate synthase [Leuconostoc mesenteroides subsp. mesenteroides]MDV8927932.1 indole-3-glycerol phosphate synthase TrpC [Leuconostoc mesenteroides]ORI89695.1 indole-3-glycerol phosphate synthase [Leuconostoc mesenteroides subsp. mesenteroides]ORI93198.1 indole-3-glycerol phosphate synthase [Leuconostoc mesenteroides subsp. mesenteroides]
MILDDLVAATRQNMLARQAQKSLHDLQKEAAHITVSREFPFEKSLAQQKISVVAEIKQASPSKGQIVPSSEFDYQGIAKDYEVAGVDAISVLTEENYFKGSLDILKTVTADSATPVLRKDFTIDPYMIYEAKVAGTQIILLIVAILTDEQLKEYLSLANELGLSVIVEAHNEEEILRAVKANARIIGVNNRNLKDFTVDFDNTKRLRQLVPPEILFISESGIKDRSDVVTLEQIGVDGILVGETFMKAADKLAAIQQLRGEK